MTKFENLVVGEKLSEAQFYSVAKVGRAKVQLLSDDGREVVLDKAYVEGFLVSSRQHSSEQEITRTEAAALFLASRGIALTVNYNTQVKEKDALEELYSLYPNKGGRLASEADFKKKAKTIISSVITGEERTMIGRHYGSINEFGRVSFIDMEIKKDPTKDYDTRTRQVDPRTINWMVIKGVKYTVKTK